MSTTAPHPLAPGQAEYETYLRENWDRLAPYEQEVGRAYLLAKEQGKISATLPIQRPEYAGYQTSGYAPAAQGTSLAVLFGYIAAFVFTPAGIVLGIYNMTQGRTGHGIAQILLSIGLIVVGVMAMVFLSNLAATLAYPQ